MYGGTFMSDTFDYFEGIGNGFDGMGSKELATPFLSMTQPGNTAGEDPGQWRNSATGECYGPEVEVIPVGFKVYWSERENVAPYSTVGRYEPGSIEIEERPPKGGKGYPTLINPKTGNQIQELFMYAVMLKDNPEAGVLLFCPTAMSMRACKSWNTKMRTKRLPNGSQAPLFGYSWRLTLSLVQNPARPNSNDKLAVLATTVAGEIVDKAGFNNFVKPVLEQAKSALLIEQVEEE